MQCFDYAKSLSGWGTADFESILKNKIEKLGAKDLPLQQGLSASGYALDNDLTVMILSVPEKVNSISVKAGVFYTGIIAGCSCADDPTPIDENNEHCEVQIEINKTTAEMNAVLLPE